MKRVFIAGHNGMVGSAIVRQLHNQSDVELVLRDRQDLDLTNQAKVELFFRDEEIDEVYMAAAKVGGIHANDTYPAQFIYENIISECNVIHSAHLSGINRLLFLGSSCIYPKYAEQPMQESALLTGVLEPTNEPYAIAKIAGIKMCESYNRQYGRDYRSVMPTNLYGPNDNYHPENSHVIPALLRRFHNATVAGDSVVTAWGSGKPMREFLHVNDMASASVFVMELAKDTYSSITESRVSHINVGSGIDCTIKELTETVAKVVGFQGNIEWDTTKPDGSPRKLMDNSRLKSLGWECHYNLEDGLQDAYQWFLQHQDDHRD